MDMEFHNLEELYNHLKPALKTKSAQMKRDGYQDVKVEDIWRYLKEYKWENSRSLYLYQMVRDIIYTKNDLIFDYIKKRKYENQTR